MADRQFRHLCVTTIGFIKGGEKGAGLTERGPPQLSILARGVAHMLLLSLYVERQRRFTLPDCVIFRRKIS